MLKTIEQTFDIIICGAGPAGSTCALALAKTGLKVAVIEKHFFPRHKVCGDLIGRYVLQVFGTLGEEYKKALLNFEEKGVMKTCRVVAPNNKHFDIAVKDKAYVVKRFDFDNLLFRLANANDNIHFFLNHEITDIVRDTTKGEVLVRANDSLFTAKLIIGCDGVNSLVAKKLSAAKKNLNHHAGAVRAYFKHVNGVDADRFELHFMKHLQGGYFWIIPLNQGVCNVGLYINSTVISKKKINLRQELKKILEQHPLMRERFKSAQIVDKLEGCGLPLGSRRTIVSGPNFMLCGDAASLVNPLSGEGIAQAIVSGRNAGWQAKKCFDENNFSAAFMKHYDKSIENKIIRPNQKSYGVQKLITNNGPVFNGLVNFSHLHPGLKKLVEGFLL